MKWAKTLHWVAMVAGLVGVLALLGAWLAGSSTFLGMSQAHLFEDAKALFLMSIAFGVGTLIHHYEEK